MAELGNYRPKHKARPEVHVSTSHAGKRLFSHNTAQGLIRVLEDFKASADAFTALNADQAIEHVVRQHGGERGAV